jgi:hypothetical protein
MLSTTCIPSDNIPRAFLYDRNELASPFTVPKGFSFVITDIIVVPDVDPNPTDRFLAVVTIGVIRTFTAGFIGAVTQHYSLTGGLVVPEEVPLNARNVLPTSTCINVQLLGYFVRGPGLDVGNPFPFQELAQ